MFAYFGHHKSGSTWIAAIILQLCRDFGWRGVSIHSTPNEPCNQQEIEALLSGKAIDFLIVRNSRREYLSQVRSTRGFHVVRDPRDIVISAYFSHRYSHPTDVWPTLVDLRKRLEKASKEEGILMECEYLSGLFQDMLNWDYAQPDILELQFESLIATPYTQMCRIFEHLGLLNSNGMSSKDRLLEAAVICLNHLLAGRTVLDRCQWKKGSISAERLLGVVHRYNFSNLAGGRKPGEEDTQHHFRKGIAGDWRNHFTAEHIDYFKQHFSPLMQTAGYSWDDPANGDSPPPATPCLL